MDEIARSVGWWVVVIGAIYVVGKFIVSSGDAKQKDKEMILSIADFERRLAYRKIWRSTNDPRIHNEVKFQYGPWALLDVELDDDEYDRKNAFSDAYQRAARNVKEGGYVCSLQDGKIVQRPVHTDT